jgi:mercuric ion binding protein
MKTVKFMITAVLALMISVVSYAQASTQTKSVSTKTETIKVSGSCTMCKTRIEKAAQMDGVSQATWDKKTQVLTLEYNPAKVKSDDVQKKIAAVGHDTEKYKADDQVYNALPGCCKYR